MKLETRMEKLILIRYGEHTDGHLNGQGRETMGMIAAKLAPVIDNKKVLIACAKVVRAVESAKVLANLLHTSEPTSYDEFYSAEEAGKFPDATAANELINNLGESCDILIVIASREYIELLPSMILKQGAEVTNLNRGEVLVIDYETSSANKL